MSVTKRRNKMISLRLSHEEYETLQSLYRIHGSRSVSEFARDAMQKVIGGAQSASSLENRLQALDGKMTMLDQEVARLVQLIESRNSRAALSAADGL